MNKHKSKFNIPMCLACVLFCLTLFSVHLMNGLFAKYSTSATGSDSARVITFGDITITETGSFIKENTLAIIPGVNLTKNVQVSFTGSESATYVFVEVIPSNWIQSENSTFSAVNGDLEWKIAADWTFLKEDNGSYVYYRALPPNTQLKDVPVIDGGNISVKSSLTRSEIYNIGNLSISFRATVVQSGGFADASAAWNSVRP